MTTQVTKVWWDGEKLMAEPIAESEIYKSQQEPCGWLYLLIVENQVVNEKFDSVNWDTKYEPFGCHGVDHGGKVTKTPLYTFPPPRPWVKLTDDERLFLHGHDSELNDLISVIEAKLKAKNDRP